MDAEAKRADGYDAMTANEKYRYDLELDARQIERKAADDADAAFAGYASMSLAA